MSESDTLYLGAAPKAATSQDRRKQPFSSELAKPRAFAFKSSYMTYVLIIILFPGRPHMNRSLKGRLKLPLKIMLLIRSMHIVDILLRNYVGNFRLILIKNRKIWKLC